MDYLLLRYPNDRYERYPYYYPYYAYPYYAGQDRRYYDTRRGRYDYAVYRRNGLYRVGRPPFKKSHEKNQCGVGNIYHLPTIIIFIYLFVRILT